IYYCQSHDSSLSVLF
nr:immunoglobulin light chain junction region [Macaca mulatta]MOX18388.1 immunoglobulin light chain junction region [Macaca mulatta]